MELWIRTQDKTKLVKVEFVNFYEGYDPIDEYDGFTTHEIWANEEEIELGTYKSKERCLEIIDEIQNLLVGSGMIIFKDIDIGDLKKEDLFPFKSLAWYSSPTLNQTDSTVTVNQLNTVVYEMPQE